MHTIDIGLLQVIEPDHPLLTLGYSKSVSPPSLTTTSLIDFSAKRNTMEADESKTIYDYYVALPPEQYDLSGYAPKEEVPTGKVDDTTRKFLIGTAILVLWLVVTDGGAVF